MNEFVKQHKVIGSSIELLKLYRVGSILHIIGCHELFYDVGYSFNITFKMMDS